MFAIRTGLNFQVNIQYCYENGNCHIQFLILVSTLLPSLIYQCLDRFGFPLAFLDRQKLLEILYNALPDKEVVVKTSKAVVRIEEQSDIARVYTYDGECYEGDLVVGADGVHSRVRAEIWRLANSIQGRQLSNSESKSGYS